MMKELFEEAETWDLEQKPASLWWSGTIADDIKEDIKMKTQKRTEKTPVRKKPSIPWDTTSVLQVDHRKAWRDGNIYRSKDMPWRM